MILERVETDYGVLRQLSLAAEYVEERDGRSTFINDARYAALAAGDSDNHKVMAHSVVCAVFPHEEEGEKTAEPGLALTALAFVMAILEQEMEDVQ